MSGLLVEIQRISEEAALLLEKAEICTDEEIQSLFEEDLHELFPGIKHLKIRGAIFQIIQNQKLLTVPVTDLKPFFPDGKLWDVLSSCKTLADHLPILKAWRDEMKKFHSFLEAHIKTAEKLTAAQTGQKPEREKMCAVLDDIHKINPKAAEELTDICRGPYAQLLTRQDLLKLLPEPEYLGVRRAMYEVIHKQNPTYVSPKTPKSFYPKGNFWDTFSSSKNLVEQLSTLKAWKDETEKWQHFLEAHIKLLENIIRPQPEQKPDAEEMCATQEEKPGINPEVPQALRGAEIPTNFFPGTDGPTLRRGTASDTLSISKNLVEHLCILKVWKREMEKWQSFHEDHIQLIEDTIRAQPEQKPDRGAGKEKKSYSQKGYEESNRQLENQKSPGGFFSRYFPITFSSEASSQEEHENKRWKFEKARVAQQPAPKRMYPQRTTQEILKYRMVVSGETFNAHQQLLGQIENSFQEFKLVEVDGSQSSEDCQIIIVFCPVVSRIGTDVNEAMKAVTGNKPVILVLMHHAYEARHVSSVKTWDSNDDILLRVNVFYHETVRGLVNCQQNKDAMFEIGNKIMKLQKQK